MAQLVPYAVIWRCLVAGAGALSDIGIFPFYPATPACRSGVTAGSRKYTQHQKIHLAVNWCPVTPLLSVKSQTGERGQSLFLIQAHQEGSWQSAGPGLPPPVPDSALITASRSCSLPWEPPTVPGIFISWAGLNAENLEELPPY